MEEEESIIASNNYYKVYFQLESSSGHWREIKSKERPAYQFLLSYDIGSLAQTDNSKTIGKTLEFEMLFKI